MNPKERNSRWGGYMTTQLQVLESDVPLSQSLLWPLQTAIFNKLGTEAWTKKGVPSYMTSNPLTTRKYAHLVLGFLRDCLSEGSRTPIDKSEPIYLFDLGTGTGRFAYIFLKQLLELMSAVPMFEGIRICCVLTDIVPANLEFCRQHAYLQSYFEQGMLDIALYHHAQKEPLHLQVAEKTLKAQEICNPLIVIANYFFDMVPKDLFCYRHGALHEGTIAIQVEAPAHEVVALDDPNLINRVRYSFNYRPVAEERTYYDEDPALQHVLEEYASKFDNTPFTLATGAYSVLRYFHALSHGRFLLIAGDQGYTTLEQLKHAGEPQLALHSSFSIPVNYHAVDRYFDHLQGQGWLTSDSDPLFQVFCGVMGGNAHDFPETALAYHEHIDTFAPKDYWKLTTLIPEEAPLPSLETLLLLLRLGNWDPMNFHAFFNMIREQLPEASLKLREKLRYAIHASWEYFYPIQALEGEFVLNLGVLLFEIQRYTEALAFFQRSLALTGGNATAYRNMAACYLALFNAEAANRCFEKIQQL